MFSKYITKLSQTQIFGIIASVAGLAVMLAALAYNPQQTIYIPSLHRSVPMTAEDDTALTGSPVSARPTMPEEQVDVALGERQLATGTVLGSNSMRTQANAVVVAPTYGLTSLPCDIVFDFILSDSAGGQLSYDLYVTNKGAGVCDDASLTLYYSGGERFVTASPAPQSGYYWKLGDMASGEQRFISLTTTGAASLPTGTEGCATAHNGSDSCTTAIQTVASAPAPTPTPKPTVTPTPTPSATATPTPLPTNTPTPTPTPIPTPTQSQTTNTNGTRPVASGKFYGVWVWDDVYKMSDANITAIVNKAAQGNFDTVYLTIDKYLELSAITNTASRTAALASYADSLAKFISLANGKGMQVYAEAGWKDWAESGKRGKAISILQYVQSFNASRSVKFAGVQYDIEPYLLSTYERNKATVLTNYINHVAEIVSANASGKTPLEFVIPHFYDCAQKWTPNITYAGKSDCTFNHLLSLLDKSPNSTISVMAYRNFSDGDNGVVKLVQEELKQAQGRPTKIVVAQETGDVDPGYVTYFGTSKAYMYSEFAKIVGAVGGMSSFGGMAVHYIDPFTALAD